MLGAMAPHATKSGYEYDPPTLDRVERRFWRDCWDSVPAEAAAEHGIELRDFGPVQTTVLADLPEAGIMNLVLGATEPGAVADGHLAAACEWSAARGVNTYVPVSPEEPETGPAEEWLRGHGFSPGYPWMKFVRGAHPPRFKAPEVEVVELTDPSEEPFGMIAANGFGAPAWAAAVFAELPGREGWRCYVARVDGIAQATGAMLILDGVAEFGIGATLETARGRGCQLALLHRRVADAVESGCHTLFVETGARVEGKPATSYRNILRAGFEEAYLRPNWRRRD
jgi:hypothetical protein